MVRVSNSDKGLEFGKGTKKCKGLGWPRVQKANIFVTINNCRTNGKMPKAKRTNTKRHRTKNFSDI